MKRKQNEKENLIELDLLDNSQNNDYSIKETKDKLYGNDINDKKPRKLGKLRTLLYIKDYPLIAIGTNSKNLNLYKFC